MPDRRLDASALLDWAGTAVGDLIVHADEINRLNVFPWPIRIPEPTCCSRCARHWLGRMPRPNRTLSAGTLSAGLRQRWPTVRSTVRRAIRGSSCRRFFAPSPR